MEKFKLFVVGVVVSICLLAVGYLIYTIEKIENESVSSKGVSGIALFTTKSDSSAETEKILKEIQSSLSGNMNVKVLGSIDSIKEVEEVIKGDTEESINYSIIEFNRSGLIKEKGMVTLRIPNKEAINYKDSLEKAEKMKDKAEGLKINIIESNNTPKLLNTYIGIEVSDLEASCHAKKILDQLILLDQ